MTLTLTKALVNAASKDAGNRSMRAAGRTSWKRDDYYAAALEYWRLLPHAVDLTDFDRERLLPAGEYHLRKVQS